MGSTPQRVPTQPLQDIAANASQRRARGRAAARGRSATSRTASTASPAASTASQAASASASQDEVIPAT
ncbi:hypothetical protein VFPBJ_04021 [Purpureocillium lilacinum]|uniref:Uncharacterized protein n=1 Tax=Purpureocillium lilacinum TaxID=33203 RepID=A0A179GU11_PURLI|nr:hypothetical protein Purlil1_6993 [Purpureocillium lilacinum]OAQ81437.1 hypothetical protein VFPBJ_04021 [Purpureocillium lilacinum]